MFDPLIIILIFLCYIATLFLIALLGERRGKRKPTAHNATVYTLALAVYCTTWTYYGSVGKATTSGMLFMTIYLGPTLAIILWWGILRKLVKIKNAHRISSIADFISARYNKSPGLAALVTLMAILGTMPYIALQLKAVSSTFFLIAQPASTMLPWISEYVNIIIIGIMILFTIMFGVRRLDPTERHEGIVLALAVESIVKLVAFLAAGIFVTYVMYDGFSDILQRLADSPFREIFSIGGATTTSSSYITWTSYLILAASAILFLPRQFHVAVVENADQKHILTAMWLLPLYLFLITLFAVPIAAGGLLQGYALQDAEIFVLGLPLQNGEPLLTILVFLGGLSAATGMIITSSMTLSTMITNYLILPAINWFEKLSFLRRHLLKFRWAAVATVILLGYWFEQSVGETYMLVNIGMLAFAAALQFAPAIIGGIFWRKGNKIGAALGLSAGFIIWLYTLFLPPFIRSGWFSAQILETGPGGWAFLRPENLFGLQGFDPISHTVFWSMFFNIGLYILGSILCSQSEDEKNLAESFVGALGVTKKPRALPRETNIELPRKQSEIEDLLAAYFPPASCKTITQECIATTGLAGKTRISITDLIDLLAAVERRLAGAIGSAAAHLAFQNGIHFTTQQNQDLSEIYGEILADLRITPAELRQKVDYHQERETLLSRHAQELENKIIELDQQIFERIRAEEALRESEQKLSSIIDFLPDATFVINQQGEVIAWNKAIEALTEIKSADILGKGNYEYALPFYNQRRPILIDMVLTPEKEVEQQYEQFERAKAHIVGETRIENLEQKDRYLLASAAPLYDSQGEIVGAIEIIHDITARKQAELELRHLRNLLTNIIDSMPSVLIGIDLNGCVTQYNREAQRLVITPAQQIIGMPLKEAFPRLAVEMPQVHAAMQTGETLFILKRAWQYQDETHYEDITIYPLTADGIEGAVIRVDDVTEKVHIEELMVQSEKMLSVGGLAAGMAHEINNPLAGMMQTASVMSNRLTNAGIPANLKAAEESGTSMQAIRKFMEARSIPRMLADIHQSGQRVAEIVDNMLSFARRSEAQISSHSLVELLEKSLELAATDYDLKKQYDFKTIEIIREFEDDLPYVPCEGSKIQQVFLNVLRNGAQAMQTAQAKDANDQIKKKRARFVLRVGHEQETQMIRVEIKDNGPGMDEITRKRIFEPFFTTKSVGEGTGLGLSVSYFIITENHRGTLDVVSSPGNGANFIIRLPLKIPKTA